jgi:hypothetical protein
MTLLVSVLCSLMCANVIDAATSPQRTRCPRASPPLCRQSVGVSGLPPRPTSAGRCSSWPRPAPPPTPALPTRLPTGTFVTVDLRARRCSHATGTAATATSQGKKTYPWGIQTSPAYQICRSADRAPHTAGHRKQKPRRSGASLLGENAERLGSQASMTVVCQIA